MSHCLQPHGLQHTGFPVHHQLPFTQTHVIESLMPSNHLILCRPLLLLPSIFPSIRVFSNESPLCIRWPKYWSVSFSINACNDIRVISFSIDFFDLLAVQGILESLLQRHSSKLISCLALTLLYDSTLTSMHDSWKSHSFEYMDLCCQK